MTSAGRKEGRKEGEGKRLENLSRISAVILSQLSEAKKRRTRRSKSFVTMSAGRVWGDI